ncbi:hypothetical protein GQ600_24459 [Phytophthora cactorum]|nr:hypothetical protein GQ600_5881 [Phytophthora cactorum]KAF1790123.1 hypothetical protein GQ600_24459 [Phytophthora cactorum]
MRLSCVFVLIAATFLATSEALADSDQIDQRSLRVHPPAASDTKYFNSLSDAARERYHDGLNVLLNAHRKKKVPQFTNE